jgi:diguanylate cyclase (GGDEF)-like protein
MIVVDGVEALQALDQENSPKLVVLDWMMPNSDGLEVCRMIRKRNQEPYTYVILLTANTQRGQIIEGLEAGADDYIVKPFDPHELRARLRAGRRIVELHEQLASAHKQLKFEATHDSLTGFLSRAAIVEALEKESARAERQRSALAVLMADIDHFKRINDTYGHLAGDAVLRKTAQRITASIRQYDSVGRYGGEEFLIVSPGCSLADAAYLAERLRQSVCEKFIDASGREINVSVSLGVAATSGMNQSSQLLCAADEALYRAKNGGRNRIVAARCPF